MLSSYKVRVKRDLDRWHANGWVSDNNRAAIAADIESGTGHFSLATALGVLASVLFGFAAISFVAAHWEEVPRLARLALLIGCVWAGYGTAGILFARGYRMFADAAILFSVAMFGASIMLISQMYNIAGEPTDGVLLWWIGALFAGVLLRSNPALAFAMVLVTLWGFMQSSEHNIVYWPFLIGWGLVAGAFAWQRWWPGLHLSALALSFFIVMMGYLLNGGHGHDVVAIGSIAVAGLIVAVERIRPDMYRFTGPLLAYAVAVAYAGLFALQFIESPERSALLVLAALSLALLLAAISHGVASSNRGLLWLGYIGFSIEILGVYWQTVGSILGTSLFFFIAAIIVTALTYVALRLAQRSKGPGVTA